MLLQCAPCVFAADLYPQILYAQDDAQSEDTQQIAASAQPMRAASALPSKYDLRDYGLVTSVKNQAAARNCWSFAAIASLESSYIKQGYGTASDTDFSEAHLVWFAQRQRTTDLSDPTYGDGLNCEKPFEKGGNWQRVAATLMRGVGLQLEKNAPWIVSYNENTLMQMQQPESARYVSYARMWGLQSVRDRSIETFKEKIMQNGAATLSYWHEDQPTVGGQIDHSSGYNAATASYYQNSHADTFNHSVAVIGWDDNYSRTRFNANMRPGKNGAWLIKGSWGTGYGDQGYYWLSYYDPSICEMASYIAAPADVFDHIYQYDGAIPKAEWTITSGNGLMANVFDAQRNELLTHVAFYSPNETPVNATIDVYISPEADPFLYHAGHPTRGMQKYHASTTTIEHVEYGYTTVELANPAPIPEGHSFTVIVTLYRADGSTVLLPVEGNKSVLLDGIEAYGGNVGDSYMSFGDNSFGGFIWYDTNDFPLGNMDYNNVPVKAMTRDVTLTEPTATVEKAPNQTTYRVGDTLNPAGLALCYTSEFGLPQTVTEGITCEPTVLTQIGTQTVSATCRGVTATFDVTVEPYETRLSFVTQPDKTTYMVGDTIDPAGLTLLYTDEYNREHTVTDGFTCEPSVLSAIGTQSVRVTYADKFVTFSVTAEPYETTLTVLEMPDKTVYMVGDTLDTAGLVLLYTDEYNEWHTVTEGFVCTPQSLSMFGEQTVTVSYGASSATFDVTVEPYEPTLTLQAAPFKTTYLYGETLDTSGLSLLYTDEFGDAVAVTEGFACDTQTLTEFGTRTVTVGYNGLSVTFCVTVEPYEPALTLLSPPDKTEYLYGETLDTTGLSLLCRNEYGEVITVTQGYTCDVQVFDSAGIQSVSVSYKELRTAFEVMVELREPTLTILTLPDKTVFFSTDTVDTTGLTLVYTDEYGETFTVRDGYTRTPDTLRALGTQTVTVTYKELTVTYDVTVEPLEPTLTLRAAPNKTAYRIGELLETEGLELLYTDEIGDALVVTEGFVCEPEYFSQVGDQSVTVSYNGLSVSFNVTVELREPTLSIVSMPEKTRYFDGDTLDLTGLKLVYSDEYGNVSEIKDGFTYESETFEGIGIRTVTVAYGDLSVTFEIKVVLMDPTLSVLTLPDKTTYLYGESLDTAGLTLLYTDDFGTETTVTQGFVCVPEVFASLGTQTVDAAYLGLSVSFDVTVEPLEPTLTLQTAPRKTAYMVGDALDTTGMTLVYTDEYGDALVVTGDFSCEPVEFAEFGMQTVTVTFNDLSLSFDVMVSAYEPTLTVVTPPDRTTYLVGELLDTAGLSLLYTDEYNRQSAVTYGFIYDVHTLDEIGTQTVTVAYSDASVTFDVTVEPYEPTLTIVSLPEKTTYMVRDTLDPTGLALLYTDKYNARHSVTEGFVCSPQTLRTFGTQTVTVTYGAKSATFDVTVEPYEPTLTLNSAPAKTTYLFGEALNTTGLSVLYTDEYGDALVVTEGFTCDAETLSEFGTQTVSVTYGGLSVTFDVTVEPHEKTLTLLSLPDKTTYLYGETFDMTGLSLQYKDEYGVLHAVTEGFTCDAQTLEVFGTNSVRVSYNEFSLTFDITVEPHEPTLTLVSLPDKTTCLAAHAPDVTGMTLVYTDEYGQAHTVTDGFTVTPETFGTLGTQTVTVSYGGISVTYEVTVEPLEPTLTLQISPEKATYLTGEAPDTSGMMLLYMNELGEPEAVTDGFAVSPDMFRTAGEQTVTVTYKGVSMTYSVTVERRETVLTLVSLPAKTAYRIGDTVDTTGLELSYTDELGQTHTVSSGFTVDPAVFNAVGTQTVTVGYAGLSVTFDVSVGLYMPALTLEHPPVKTAYFVGETLDTRGLALLYSDEYGKEHPVNDGFSCSPQQLTKSGTQTVTLTYAGLSASFTVTVKAVEAESIRVETLPDNRTYIYKRSPDFSGLGVVVHYNDGHEQTVRDLSKMSIRPQSDKRVRNGSRTFVVTVEGKSATFDMQVRLAWWQWFIVIILFGFIWY